MNKSTGNIAPFSDRASRPRLVVDTSSAPLALIVLGMHRSGTSALTRVLSLSGYALPATLMNPSPDNEEGFWESRPIADLNDELLGLIGTYWDDPFGFSPTLAAGGLLAGHRKRAVKLIRSEFPPGSPMVLKDPRITLLYEFWRDVLTEAGYQTAPVIAVRHPLDVAASLAKRNKFPSNKSLLIWLSYQMAAERATREGSRAFVIYDELIADWSACLDRMERSLGVTFARRDPEAELQIERFLRPDLRHHSKGEQRETRRQNIPGWIDEAYDWFKRAAGEADADASLLSAVGAEYLRQRKWFGPIVADLRLEASQAAKRAEEQIRKVETRLLAVDATYRKEVDARNAEIQVQKQVHADVEARLRASEQEAHRRVGELEGRVLEIERLRSTQITEREQRIALLQGRLERVEAAERQAANFAAGLQKQLQEAEVETRRRVLELEDQILEIEKIRALAISERDQQAAQLQEGLARAEAAEQQASNYVSRLEKQFLDTRAEARQRIEELEGQVLEIERLRSSEIAERDQQAVRLQEDLVRAESAKQEASNYVSRLEEQLRDAQAEARQRIVELDERVLEIERLRSSEIAERDQHAARLRDKLESAEASEREAAAYAAALEKQLEEVEAAARLRGVEIEQQAQEIDRLRSAEIAERNQRAVLLQRLARAEAAEREAAASVTDLASSLRETEAGARQRVLEMEARILEIERIRSTQVSNRDQHVALLQQKLTQAEASERNLAGTLSEASRAYERDLLELRFEIEGLRNSSALRVSELLNEIQRLEVVVSQLKADHALSEAAFRAEIAARNVEVDRLAQFEIRVVELSNQLTNAREEGIISNERAAIALAKAESVHRESLAIARDEHATERLRLESKARAQSDDAQRVIANLQSELAHAQMVVEERGHQLDRLIREYHELRSSTLWRIAQPLRWLGCKLPILSKGSRRVRSAIRSMVRPSFNGPGSTSTATPAVSLRDESEAVALRAPPVQRVIDPEPIARYLSLEHGQSHHAQTWRRHCTLFPLPIDPKSSEKPNVTLSDGDAEAWIRACADAGAHLPQLSEAPEVSIIVPVYNQLAFTLSAIASVYALKTKYTFEIIVGDDGSTDQTRLLENTSLPRVRVVRNEKNVGFLLNCNLAAERARGAYIVLLNNDTVVLPGWLDELIDTLKADPKAGLVGSKLLYANGTLQEAGGIVWQDGSAWNWGRNQDPRDPRYCYAREVDYCSGASIAMDADLWRELGGFDETTYENSYYEDVDLAFRVREAGRKVIYQPLSAIVHFEGISSGIDLGAGTKKYQISNGERFFARWRETLKKHGPNAHQPLKESERRIKGRLLIIDSVTPTPDHDAGSLVMMEMIRAFQQCDWHVSFVPEDNYAHLPAVTPRLQRCGVETLHWPHFRSVEQIIAKRGSEYDIVLISRVGPATKHLETVRAGAPQAKIIFNTVDLHFLREQREAQLQGDPTAMRKAEKTKAHELQIVSKSELTIVHSTVERDLLAKEVPRARVAVFPWVSGVKRPAVPISSREAVLFVGGFRHAPNVDGLRWFLQEIWPRVRSQKPDATFNVVGPDAPAEFQLWNGRNGVNILGWVQNLAPELDRARVSVAPLRYGAGVKGKVVSALSSGVPVVCTTIASEGMELRPGVDMLVADEPDDFAKAILRLLTDDAVWADLSSNGLEFVESNYSFAAACRRVNEMISAVGALP